jgi:hypothetical protein
LLPAVGPPQLRRGLLLVYRLMMGRQKERREDRVLQTEGAKTQFLFILNVFWTGCSRAKARPYFARYKNTTIVFNRQLFLNN